MKRFLITFLVLLLIASAAFAGFFIWSRNRVPNSGEESSFVVLYNGVPLNELQAFLSVSVFDPLSFEVRGSNDYTVKIVPCASARVSFTVSGISTDLENTEDLTEGFEISRDENTLSVIPKRRTLAEIISLSYGGAEVILADDTDLSQDLFALVVSNGETEYRVDFALNSLVVDGVTIYPVEVLF